MKNLHTPPRYFDALDRPNTKRFLIRDLVGNECFDWIADVWPERQTIDCHGFPFRLARRWTFADATASIRKLTVASRLSDAEAFARWSQHQTQTLSRERGNPVALATLDNLFFDSEQNTWWKSDDPKRVLEVFHALHTSTPAQENWEKLMAQLVHSRTTHQQYFDGFRPKPITTNMPLEAATTPCRVAPAMVDQIRRGYREPQGFLDMRNALLPVSAFVGSRGFNRVAAVTAIAIAEHSTTSDTPLAHTLLIRPPHEWVEPLRNQVKWTDAEILTQVQNLSLALNRAGIRPIADQNSPLISRQTSVPIFAGLVGPKFINPEKAWLLTRGGVSTIQKLLDASPVTLLELAPIMPSDLDGFARALRAVGYQYPYRESDLTHNKMKRTVNYITEDGQTFASRTAARQHEIDGQRRIRIRACVERVLRPASSKPLAVTEVVDALCQHAGEFTDALSARAAVRAAKTGGTKKTRGA